MTTYRVGLAVPDWPTTFGINMFLYDFWNAPFGVRVEHAHRLYGAAVGLATLVLAGWFLVFEPRRWMKGLGVLAVVAVIVQGVLGGTRVTQVSTFLAAVHGCTGQAFFGLMVALCVLTGRDWQSAPDALGRRRSPATPLGWSSWAWCRPRSCWGAGCGIMGPGRRSSRHAVLAAAVWVHAVSFSGRVERRRASCRQPGPVGAGARLSRRRFRSSWVSSRWFTLLPFDGTPRPVSFYQAVVRTGHQTNGALLLAAAVVLDICGLSSSGRATFAPRPDRGRRIGRGRPEPAALDWEAVA